MTDSRETAALARAAADAIRGLSHAALHGDGLGQPSDAYDVLGSLSLAASRLGQALAHLARFLDLALADGRLGHDLAPGMLHWCIAERAIGVVTGEVGAGKTVAVRTVLAGLDACRHTIIYLPNPMIGVRGLHEAVVATFGGQPDRGSSG